MPRRRCHGEFVQWGVAAAAAAPAIAVNVQQGVLPQSYIACRRVERVDGPRGPSRLHLGTCTAGRGGTLTLRTVAHDRRGQLRTKSLTTSCGGGRDTDTRPLLCCIASNGRAITAERQRGPKQVGRGEEGGQHATGRHSTRLGKRTRERRGCHPAVHAPHTRPHRAQATAARPHAQTFGAGTCQFQNGECAPPAVCTCGGAAVWGG